MLIGSDCSIATEPVAEIAHNWNLVQVSQLAVIIHMCSKLLIIKFVAMFFSTAIIIVSA